MSGAWIQTPGGHLQQPCAVKGCLCAGNIHVTDDQITKTEARFSSGRGFGAKIEFDDESEPLMCADHAFNVIKAHADEAAHSATGQNMKMRVFVHDILMVTGSHEVSPSAEVTSLTIRRPKMTAEPEEDELTKTFKAARAYISDDCFIYTFSMAQYRHILHLNGVPGYNPAGRGGGRHPRFMNSFEGKDVLRFFSVFKITRGNTSVRALRGGSLERKGALIKNAAGHVDLRFVNLLVPSERILRMCVCASVVTIRFG